MTCFLLLLFYTRTCPLDLCCGVCALNCFCLNIINSHEGFGGHEVLLHSLGKLIHHYQLGGSSVSVRLQSKPFASISSSSRYTRAPSHVLGAPHVHCLISHCASHCAVYNTFISTCSHSCNLMLHNIAHAHQSLAQHVICASCVPVHACMFAHSSPESNCVRTTRPACGEGNRIQM